MALSHRYCKTLTPDTSLPRFLLSRETTQSGMSHKSLQFLSSMDTGTAYELKYPGVEPFVASWVTVTLISQQDFGF